jgi:hypothetical protein
MIQLNINGNPVTITWRQALLAAVISFGSFTGGATYPDLNPLNLMGSECEGE